MVIILTGPSGSGKTTVGQLLAQQTGWTFYDADDLHSRQNKEKMSQGIPLTDDDRKPWLEGLSLRIKRWQKREQNVLLACSALKKIYRDLLGVDQKTVKTVFLKGSLSLIEKRLKERTEHFTKSSLLKSQWDILEEPTDGLVVDAAASLQDISKTILQHFRQYFGLAAEKSALL